MDAIVLVTHGKQNCFGLTASRKLRMDSRPLMLQNGLDEIIPAEIRVRASDNLMWVIASNSSGHYSSWPTCIARPDGSLESLERGVPGILYREFPDDHRTRNFPSWTHNNKVMKLPENETYHNGTPSRHPRALNTGSSP